MSKPEIILEQKLARVVIAETTLPKGLVSNRDELLPVLTQILARCLAYCGFSAEITIGATEDALVVRGRRDKNGGAREDEGSTR